MNNNELKKYWDQRAQKYGFKKSIGYAGTELKVSFYDTAHTYYFKKNILKNLRNKLTKLPNEHEEFKILEIGCGKGRWASFLNNSLTSNNFHYLGIDISEAMLQEFRQQDLPNNFKCQNLDISNDIPNGRFDFVFSFTVIQHIPFQNHEAVLSNIHKSLKPDGELHLFEIRKETKSYPEHVFPRSVSGWTNMLENAGLTITNSEPALLLNFSDNITNIPLINGFLYRLLNQVKISFFDLLESLLHEFGFSSDSSHVFISAKKR